MAEDEIRSFEVSDPRKSFAGHTVYRVSAKVCKKGSPGLVEEIIVWKRFSEFRRFQKDLLKLYKPQHDEAQFPHLPKATFFDRFDEAVIEERRKSSFNLLTFADSIPQITKSQCFRNFFEGSNYQRTACSSNSSRGSSFSSSEGDITESRNTNKDDKPVTQDQDEAQGYLELGGVWLYKQPSLVEGLDKTETTVDETITDRTALGDEVDSPLPADTPGFIRRSLSDEGSEEDVFEDKKREHNEERSCDTDEDEDSNSGKTSKWFERAISICSEGDDIEALASEAENDEYVNDWNFPKPFSEFGGAEVMKRQEENERLSEGEGCCRRDEENDILENSLDNVQNVLNTEGNIDVKSKRKPKKVTNECRETTKDESRGASNSPRRSIHSKEKRPNDSATTMKQRQTKTESCRFDPQEASILSDSRAGDDYLFSAAKVVRLALNCEVEGQFKEAFHLYKKCVSLLLSGVQEEKDAKRRDAVRCKTAQYLLKAEALYTAYVHESVKDLPGNPSQSLGTISKDDDQEVFSPLQLADYAVIGVIGKVMLVENRCDKSTYVIKVLPKSEGHLNRVRHKSKGTKSRKSLLKAAYAPCPFIVKLYQHCETRTSVILLLGHARGGLLWDYLTPLIRRQHQQNIATSKSQCYVHNLKETELNNITRKTFHHSLGKDKNNCLSLPQEKEIPSNTGYPSTERITNSSQKDDLKIQPENENLVTVNSSLENNDSKNNPESCKKTSTFASLDEYFSSPSQKSIESYVRVWMAEIILALAHLHSSGSICRDLNPKNILLSDEGHVLLTHFSVWEDVNEESDLLSLEEEYCAPELFRLEEATSAADWWSVGALFYEMLTGQVLSRSYPWGIRSHTEIETSSNISTEATALIQELLIVTPSERLGSGVNGLDDIKSHPFFIGVDWSALKTNNCQS